jgi:outer membrane cobalamin receptor
MIRSIAFVLSTTAARDPVAALADGTVPVEPAAVEDRRPPHVAPVHSWVYTSDYLERLGVRSLGDALRLTPGVVIAPNGAIFIQGAPLDDGSVMLDGVSLMGAPRAMR